MPFDQRDFQIEARPDVFSLDGLIAWLETQDPETEYNYLDTHNEYGGCLICRYLTAMGVPFNSVGGDYYSVEPLVRRERGNPIFAVPIGRPHTYGAALERARALKAGTP